MERYCANCGNQLTDDAVFCEKCGCKFTDNSIAEEISQVKNEEPVLQDNQTTQQNTEPRIYSYDEIQEEVAAKNKPKLRDIIITITIAVVIVSGIVLGIVYLFNHGIVTENEDGEEIFKFTVREYIDSYNEVNSDDIQNTLDSSDFIHNTNEDDIDLYMNASTDDNIIIVLFTDGSSFKSNVTEIKVMQTGLYKESEEGENSDTTNDSPDEIPDEIVFAIRALYPNLSFDEAYEIADEARLNFITGGGVYKEIQVKNEYDSDTGISSWFITT